MTHLEEFKAAHSKKKICNFGIRQETGLRLGMGEKMVGMLTEEFDLCLDYVSRVFARVIMVCQISFSENEQVIFSYYQNHSSVYVILRRNHLNSVFIEAELKDTNPNHLPRGTKNDVFSIVKSDLGNTTFIVPWSDLLSSKSNTYLRSRFC